jgi:hypothetical protein
MESKLVGEAIEANVPVRQEHGNIHARHHEYNMEPRIVIPRDRFLVISFLARDLIIVLFLFIQGGRRDRT